MSDPVDRWRTTAEVLEYLAISEATLLRWMSDRGLPVHRVGRTLRFKFSELDAWIRSGEQVTGDRPQRDDKSRTGRHAP